MDQKKLELTGQVSVTTSYSGGQVPGLKVTQGSEGRAEGEPKMEEP